MANQQDIDAIKRARAQKTDFDKSLSQKESFDMIMRNLGSGNTGSAFARGGAGFDPDLIAQGLRPNIDFKPGKLETEFLTPLGRFGSDMTRKGASFMREGDRSIARSRQTPEYQKFQDFINQMFEQGMAQIPGAIQFQQDELDRASGLRGEQQGRLSETQDRLSQLTDPNQSALALPPELMALIDQHRNLAVERSQVGVQDAFTKLNSLQQARLGSQGLGTSTIAARASNEIQNDLNNRLEQARIQAEEQSLQREFDLRGKALQERGQQQQGLLGGANIAQNQLAQLQQLMQSNSPGAQAALQATLGQLFAQPLNAFTQQNLNNEQRSLQTAAGVGHATDDSGGFGSVFGSIGKTLGGLLGGALTGGKV